ncbi:hypothetical protein QRX60_41005 [Amycolatopsis mongoliensis]|uniref:Transmembrane protein n=1 Tax=Amycolatopsis mongoliensis TaxID=715475 RepID=A0A9Y2NC67_9PSEU|nr:hypothetical protein [Amycolatopsis sp. 4-36]WIY00376.1 hypothetical protein QRX60_41005 [Amycolatopsis sp. 4-36]
MRLTRLRHTLLPGRGTVARPSDRVQAVLLMFVLLLSLAAAAGAVLFGIGLHASEAARSAEQLASRYTATAVLQADGPAVGLAGRSGIPGESGPAAASWTTRDGRQRTGEVDAPSGTVAGNEIPIWLDASGSPAERPLTPASAAVDSAVLAVGLWAGVVFLLWLTYRGVVLVLDRFRLAHWQQEWFREQERLGRS